jgi:hypothetical protein
MSAPGRPKRELPLGGDGAPAGRQGGLMSAPGRPKRELLLWGMAPRRCARGVT